MEIGTVSLKLWSAEIQRIAGGEKGTWQEWEEWNGWARCWHCSSGSHRAAGKCNRDPFGSTGAEHPFSAVLPRGDAWGDFRANSCEQNLQLFVALVVSEFKASLLSVSDSKAGCSHESHCVGATF